MNKKIIFIDWDGTLCWSRFWESLSKENLEFSLIVERFFVNNKNIVRDWMRGKYSSEEINEMLSNKTTLPPVRIWQSFVFDCQNMQLDHVLVELIENLRKKFIVILITGNMDCFTRFTVPA